MLLTNIMYITQTISTVSADTVIDEIVEIVFREKNMSTENVSVVSDHTGKPLMVQHCCRSSYDFYQYQTNKHLNVTQY